jgi:hypothetical protein
MGFMYWPKLVQKAAFMRDASCLEYIRSRGVSTKSKARQKPGLEKKI